MEGKMTTDLDTGNKFDKSIFYRRAPPTFSAFVFNNNTVSFFRFQERFEASRRFVQSRRTDQDKPVPSVFLF
jgi:hypothetical protein